MYVELSSRFNAHTGSLRALHRTVEVFCSGSKSSFCIDRKDWTVHGRGHWLNRARGLVCIGHDGMQLSGNSRTETVVRPAEQVAVHRACSWNAAWWYLRVETSGASSQEDATVYVACYKLRSRYRWEVRAGCLPNNESRACSLAATTLVADFCSSLSGTYQHWCLHRSQHDTSSIKLTAK